MAVILRLEREKKTRYLLWSTVADAPLTRGMTLKELQAYVKQEEGNQGLEKLVDRLDRVSRHGTSSAVPGAQTPEELTAANRAGPGETELTLDQIWERYCG